MNFTIKSIDCPPGVYRARFTGAETMSHPEFGDGLRFQFEVVEGPQKGKRPTRTTSAEPTTRNAAGRMLADIAGATPANGVTVHLDDFLDGEYTIVVRENETGRTRIESVCAVTEGEAF